MTRRAPLCPECRDGKHRNCTGATLDADDNWTVCGCTDCAAADDARWSAGAHA